MTVEYTEQENWYYTREPEITDEKIIREMKELEETKQKEIAECAKQKAKKKEFDDSWKERKELFSLELVALQEKHKMKLYYYEDDLDLVPDEDHDHRPDWKSVFGMLE